MFGRKFYFSWIMCSIIMFGLSYTWHGVVLNDFSRLSYPLEIFLQLATLVYFIIGLVIAFLISFFELKKKGFLKGLILGGVTGAFIYMIAFVLGISFTTTPKLSYIAIDLVWQIAEGGIGGLAGGLVYDHFSAIEKFEKANQ